MNHAEVLLSYRQWLRAVASRMTTSARVDDLAQEGWISMWKALEAFDGRSPLDFWLKRKAYGRMTMLVSRDWKTNKEQQYVWTDFTDPDAADSQSYVPNTHEVEYHRDEIRAAVSNLTEREREYVWLRFWRDFNWPELTKYFGYEPSGLRGASTTKLKRDLAHLAEVS